MGNSLPSSTGPRLLPPRFTPPRLSGGLAACVWLWTFAGAVAAAPTADQPPSASYQGALDAFNHEDYSRALSLLEQVPADNVKGSRAQADLFNLKGAILLRQHRYTDARAAFDEAAKTDPAFWAARFNKVEVSFREKRYADSHQQFSELLGRTDRLWHVPERHFIEYKMMLTDVLNGNEKPAADFIAAHTGDEPRPLAWYYLSAALDYHHGRRAIGDAYLQQVGKNYAPSSEQVYADSFDTLGWISHGSGADRVAARGQKHAPAESEPAPVLARATPDRKEKRPDAKSVSKTVAVVQLMPEGDAAPAGSRATFHAPSGQAVRNPDAANMPPSETGMNFPAAEEESTPTRASTSSPVAGVLARRKAHPSPSPSASPADSPAAGGTDSAAPSPSASPDDATASPAPATAPSGTPSPAFVAKYEAAMVQFLQKNYPETKKLLDEADAIQPNQPNSVSLRNQLFKQYYETAYTAYQHADYVGALTQLDGADSVGSNAQNQSDAYNLRGLILSKQRNYADAENMFHKAIQTDPGLWAAKFNYAEVPFNYRNFTVARTRFEELFSQTDPAKQPVEAELTQFKVFLTLLLEGKEDAARTFMQHFNFSGATPARYFCQAALNFYTGEVDKAQGWIDSARKEYPARKSSSFLEAFYRVGWLTDPNAPATGAPGTALAAASVPPAAGPSPAMAAASSPAASLTPFPSPAATASAVATSLLTASPTAPAVAKATPAVTVAPLPTAPAIAKATPAPAVPSPTVPALAKIPMPTAAPLGTAPAIARGPVPPVVPSPTAPPAAAAPPRPFTPAPVASLPATVPSPAPSPTEAPVEAAQPAASSGDLFRVLVVGVVGLYFLYVVGRIALSAMNPKPKRTGVGKASGYGREKTAEADQIEAPRR